MSGDFNTVSEDLPSTKKTYQVPEIVELGNIAEMTNDYPISVIVN